MRPVHPAAFKAMVSSRVLIVFAVICIWMWASPAASGQNTGAYQDAIDAFDNGRYEQADSLIAAFAQTDSLTTDWVLLQAKLFAERKQFDLALERFLGVLEMTDGQHIEAKTWIERAGFRDAEILKSELPELRELVDEAPNSTAIRLRLAEAYAADEQFEESISHYKQLLSGDIVNPEMVKSMLVTIAASGSNYQLGEETAQKYAELFPDKDDLHMRLGYFRMWRGKFAGAQRAFDRALEINPANEQATSGVGALEALRQDEAAKRALTQSLYAAVERDSVDASARLALIDHLLVNGLIYDANKHLVIVSRCCVDTEVISEQVDHRLNRIAEMPSSRASSSIDRIYLQKLNNPGVDEQQFRLIESLLTRDRYFDAYDELSLISDSLQWSDRWKTLFERADAGLIQTHGESPVFQIDRLTHQLRFDPENLGIRYALVDSLASNDRYFEALQVLTVIPAMTEADMLEDVTYMEKLNRIATERLRFSSEQVDSIRSELETLTGAGSVRLRRELAEHLVILGEETLAQAEFETLIGKRPDDIELNLDWIEFLHSTDQAKRAFAVAEHLLHLYGSNPEVQKAFVLSSLRSENGESAEQIMVQLVEDPGTADTDFLLEVANYYVDSSHVNTAEELLARVDSLNGGVVSSRFSSVKELLEREKVRLSDDRWFADLYEARVLSFNKKYPEAVQKYEAYFEGREIELRSELKELVGTHVADNNFDAALDTLKLLQQEAFSYDLEKEIARIKTQTKDFRGALASVDSLTSINPRDYESQLTQAEALQELGVFDEASRLVEDARSYTEGSDFLGDRRSVLESNIKSQLLERGLWTNYEFAGIIIPTAYSVHAEGGGTSYDRRTQGLRAEVTLPAGAVVTAGFNSHFISGTRRLVPEAEFVKTSINQLYGSAFLDLTAPIRSEKAPYTNRVFVEAGLYDYEGARSVGYFNIRYWKQVRGKYIGMIGLRTDEGSIDLWSPGGGEFNLRLMQLDVNSQYVGAMPDSLIRLAGRLAVNVVSDNLGLLSGSGDRNIGSDLMLEAGYKVINHTYAGIAYHQLNYESRTDTYFSPENWELTEFFLEHEREAFSKWYVRLRGSIGAISRSSGQMAQRLEADVIKRIGDNLSITLQSTLGETSRALGSGVSSLFNRYNTFHLTGSVRWTL